MRIEKIKNLEPWMDFIQEVNNYPELASPCIGTPYYFERNLLMAVNRPGQTVIGVFQDDEPAGLFVFIVSSDDQNVEMKVDVCRSAEAYEAVIEYMQEEYAGCQADFVFNPDNRLLTDLLIRKGAAFDPVQVKMVFSGVCPAIDTEGVEVLSERYHEQYLAMHVRDVYWTGDKVIKADKFRVFIGVEEGLVTGYADVSYRLKENEVYSLQVKDPARETEWSRKLLAKALEMNRPNGMMVLVNEEDTSETALFESVGFEKVPGHRYVTVTWMLPVAK
jgi:GNAT superfamily N-acetyltransferase